MAVSCENLERPTSSKKVRQRRWNSAEVLGRLSGKPTSRQWKLAGWIENKQEGDGSSDCDSSYSLDSLSSAYATALAEQLKQEDREMSECDEVESEAESVDSKMSQDSLAMESSQKNTTVRPTSKPTEVCRQRDVIRHCQPSGKEGKVFNRQSTGEDMGRFSSLDSCTSDEMPAEAYWRHCASSFREPENLLVSTDAWSSTDTTDSPRIDRASAATIRQILHNPADRSSSIQSSTDLSDSPRSSESQDWSNTNCTEDVLININPLNINRKVHQRVPEDLPMHNKFTNWSGVSYQPTSIASSSVVQSASKRSERVKNKSSCESPGTSESQQSGLEVMTPRSRRAKEIEMLRKEREQVMANVRLDMNSHQLTVEMTEAKLHYGLGETDALLKMLQTSSKEEPSSVPTKQQLYDRHRRSIDGLRQEREARLQTCRRARSLSPGPSKNSPSPDQGAEPPTRTESPSRRREYLQQLRQEVVESTRIPEPPKQSGQCPSEIELMLRDYGRAREEARTEIARARDRLRERTEQEKRRLQQQALSRAVKEDLRLRTRVSSSTLCTGSSLSLSSGPTSGYNSSNTVLLKEGVGVNSAQTLQVPGWPEDGSLNIRGRPPMRASQNFDTRRPWLSVQDVRLEVPVFGSDSQLSSSYGHHDTPSPRIASSIATSYQDIAKYTHDRAIAEVRSAAAGDLGNLLEGRAAGGWRYQGTERGVQAFYKPSSCPTMHGFLGATELERPLPSLWCMVRDHSKAHLYNESVRSAWTRPLDDSTQFVYLLTDTSVCHLSQPRDFCCISTESKQQDEWVLAMRSVFEESLPRPTVDAVRGELLPSAWVLQPTLHHGREVVRVVYLLQVDLGTPALPQRLLNVVARKQAAVIAELDTFLSL
ncbi:hypothetical protein COCON_G00017970 [Conger conger]|uniref:START domain-containing protein n=1 Tax=Conger conger TaxID=82655 RepID=A0A9Q1I9S3_CONCO|nr:hypothetical protein COCON_G00017970 [Conger conger]